MKETERVTEGTEIIMKETERSIYYLVILELFQRRKEKLNKQLEQTARINSQNNGKTDRVII